MPTTTELQESFQEFTSANLSHLVKIARSLTGNADAADELVQTAMEKACRSWSKVMRATDQLSYVRRILVNSAYDSWRRKRRFLQIFQPSDDPAEPVSRSPWGDPQHNLDRSAVIEELMRPLSPRERAVITLRFLADLTEAATAYELGIAVGTVKSTTARALSKMRVVDIETIGA
ncbi:MAG: SigE family RNA polymerase sigma factor [Arachnia propionica]|uniref:SigE family RNA polymerase sigma factor n=1 Tax=Arachnia propionica TaxID=1750 RepID=UPI0026F7B7F5|nr:SigE family RNA polymerase sigma factor [Arachnia propionica]